MINVIHYPDTNSVEVTWLDDEGKQTRCHSYADVQMYMLRADLGADADAYADLIATVESSIKPPIPPTMEELQQVANAEALAYLSSTDWMVTRFAENGTPIPDDVKAKRQEARDAIVHPVMPL